MKKDKSKSSRKIRYTKMVLRDSLIELMKEKPVLKISIKDICDLADVSRSTFYAHYKDQYELLQHIQEETLTFFEELLEKYRGEEGNNVNLRMTEEFLQYIADNSNSIQVLMSENGDINFQKKIFAFTRQKNVLHYITAKNKSDNKTQEYFTVFTINGTIALVQQWLKNSMDMPVHELSRLIVKLALR
jgi:AcrR family transcriptional regulator